MPAPIPLILLGVGALLLFAGDEEKKKKPEVNGKGNGLPPGGVEDFPFGQCLDDNMPPQMKQEINQILATVTDPQALDTAAAAATQAGFPIAAACLKQKADELRGAAPSPGPTPGGIPGIPGGIPGVPTTPKPEPSTNMIFTVRWGDFPYGLAQYYTGQGARFKELEPLNPQLGPMITRQGPKGSYSIYQNWAPGLEIQLPASWKPYEKPLPVAGTQTPSTIQP